jgi:hypothetical protein
MDERRKEIMKAYQDASSELRYLHDDEFQAILKRIYDERNIDVRKRKSRKQAETKRVNAAYALIASQQAS